MPYLIPNYELAQKIGQRLELDATSVGDLIQQCSERFGEDFTEAIKRASILVNGRSVNLLKGKDTPLSGDDSVWLVLPSAGG
jgi:molybdopterin converting factor small subunit